MYRKKDNVVVYHQKVVAAVKVSGKVLRENQGEVILPFGSEYSILIKNLNSVRIKAKVSVDGQDATEGTWLVVEPNSSLNLERFIRNGNMESGHRFKFIERTKDIENHRGIKADDGIIRVEFKTEQEVVKVPRIKYEPYYFPYPQYPPWYPYPWKRRWNDGSWRDGIALYKSDSNVYGNSLQARAMSINTSDAGITVPGSQGQQQFHSVPNFNTYSQSEVIVLRLRGEVGGKKASKPVTVKSKTQCQTCGKNSKGGVEFCSKCGTNLQAT